MTRGAGAALGGAAARRRQAADARGAPGGRARHVHRPRRAGADLARDVLGRLRASERLRAHVAALVRHHLRLGFLVHEPQPLARRTVYRYLRDCAPVQADVTLLSVADRLATRGAGARRRRSTRTCVSPRGCSPTRWTGTRRAAARAAGARRRAGRRAGHRSGARAGRAAGGARRGALRGRDLHPRAGARAATRWRGADVAPRSSYACAIRDRPSGRRARISAGDGPGLHLLQDPRRRAARADRRRRRAHDRVHGHRARHARARAGDPAGARARPARGRRARTWRRSRSPRSGWRGARRSGSAPTA